MRDEQFVMIAESEGWQIANPENKRLDYRMWIPPGKIKKDDVIYIDKPPNYFGDLNVMHETEKSLANRDDGAWGVYVFHLREIARRDQIPTLHTNAEQRAEAYALALITLKN